ncbi:ankyrin repeat domain-containing protein [bacterium]|nr:ankyrin repeat domain-containing protein [bacterium]
MKTKPTALILTLLFCLTNILSRESGRVISKMPKIVLSIVLITLALISTEIKSDVMLLEIIEKREISDNELYTREISLKSINTEKTHFYFLSEGNNERLVFSSDLVDGVKIDTGKRQSSESLSLSEYEFNYKIRKLLPLGLSRQTKSKTFWFFWREARNFLIKGLDDEHFMLNEKEDHAQVGSGLKVLTQSYWFHRNKGIGKSIDQIESDTVERAKDIDQNSSNADFILKTLLTGQKTKLKQYCENGGSLNVQNKKEVTPLITLCFLGGQFENIEFLLRNGAKADHFPDNGSFITPLITASAGGHEKYVELLIKNGAKPIKSQSNEGVLFAAAESGNPAVAKMLINSGADLDFQTDFGETSLHNSVYRERIEFAKVLIDAGAKLNLVTVLGETPLDYAIKSKKAKMTKLLMNNGALTKNELAENKANADRKISEELEVKVNRDGSVDIKKK